MIVSLDALEQGAVYNQIAVLERELFGRGAWSQGVIRMELDAPARTYIVDVSDTDNADNMGNPVIRGYAGFWYDGDDAELMTIGVARAYQRQGIAAGLLGRLIEGARDQGARRMLLEVRVDNEPAKELYAAFGFERIGIRKRYYQPGNLDAYTMSLDLAPRMAGFAGAGQDEPTGGAPVPRLIDSEIGSPPEKARTTSPAEYQKSPFHPCCASFSGEISHDRGIGTPFENAKSKGKRDE